MPNRKKVKRNISGLRNQPKATAPEPDTVDECQHEAQPSNVAEPSRDGTEGDQRELVGVEPGDDDMDDKDSDVDEKWDTHLRLGSTKPCWDEDSEDEYIGEVGCGMEDIANEEFQAKMVALAVELGDDPRDEDWIPESLRRKHQHVKKGELTLSIRGYHDINLCQLEARPPTYVKGPDVGSKSKRSQSRYRNLLKGQETLESIWARKHNSGESRDGHGGTVRVPSGN